MNSESEFFADLSRKLKLLIEQRTPEIIKRLSQENQQIEIKIHIQSLDTDVKVQINTTEKYRLLTGVTNCSGNHILINSSQFQPEIFKEEFLRIASYHLEKCKFYSLPMELVLFIKPDNKVSGRVTTNFRLD